jgi:ubiquitin-like modifier-activating enzyme ATG7
MPVVQFAQFSSIVQPTLWHELSRLKLEVLRLSDETVPLTAAYSTGRTIKDRNTGQEVALGCNILVGGEGFSESYRSVCIGLRSYEILIMPAHLCIPLRLGGS